MATLKERLQLFEGLLCGDYAYSGPIFVDLDVTERCNLRCVGCVYHSPDADIANMGRGDISPELVARLSSELRDMGAHTVILQGAGEPLLHPDIAEIIATFKRAGFEVQLLSNGTLLNRKAATKLIEAGLDLLRVSLWASTAEEYRTQYPGTNPGYFERVLENLRLFACLRGGGRDAAPRLMVYFPINALNYRSIDRLVDLARRIGCDGVNLASWSVARGVVDKLSLSADQEREVVDALRSAQRKLESFGLHHNIEQALLRYRTGKAFWEACPCYITWFHVRIRVDGTVQPCGRCGLSLGSLREQSFRQLWNGPALRAFRRQAMTRDGLSALGAHCDCCYCCFAHENLRVHRLFKWFWPLARLFRSAGNDRSGSGAWEKKYESSTEGREHHAERPAGLDV